MHHDALQKDIDSVITASDINRYLAHLTQFDFVCHLTYSLPGWPGVGRAGGRGSPPPGGRGGAQH